MKEMIQTSFHGNPYALCSMDACVYTIEQDEVECNPAHMDLSGIGSPVEVVQPKAGPQSVRKSAGLSAGFDRKDFYLASLGLYPVFC